MTTTHEPEYFPTVSVDIEVSAAKKALEEAVTNLSKDGQARYHGSDWRTRNEAWSAIQTGADPDTVARQYFED